MSYSYKPWWHKLLKIGIPSLLVILWAIYGDKIMGSRPTELKQTIDSAHWKQIDSMSYQIQSAESNYKEIKNQSDSLKKVWEKSSKELDNSLQLWKHEKDTNNLNLETIMNSMVYQ